MQFDSIRSRAVLFGGYDGGTYLNDTWEWDGSSWAQQTPAGATPSRRDYHAMAFDAPRGVMVCYGGYNGTTVFDETWEWNGLTWNLRILASRPARLQNHGMAYDSARSQMVVYGGWNTPNNYFSNTWEWDGTPQGWTLKSPASRPAARRGHIMVYDAARGRTVVCGGHLTNQVLNGDTWEWDGTNWSQRFPLASPVPHVVATATYDSVRREILMTGFGPANDTWRYVPVTPAAVLALGQGCSGTTGVPTLTASPSNWPSSLPWAGDTFTAEVGNVGPSPQNVPFLAVGFSSTSWGGTPLPMSLAQFGMHGCTLYVEPVLNVALANNGGRAEWLFGVPSSAGFIGFHMFVQGFVLDTGVSPPRAAVTNYLELVIGGR